MSSFTSTAACTYSPAGQDYKATIGLGLGLPAEVFHTSLNSQKSVGLGIYFDFENWDEELLSPSTSSDDFESSLEMPSSPMMGTRRARRPAQPEVSSPTWSEYAPMRTPSPSLMASKNTATTLFSFAPPRVPSLHPSPKMVAQPATPMHSYSSVLPSTESIASGLNLLCLSDEELITYVPPATFYDQPGAGVGLGLSLAELEGPELVFTLHEHGFRDADNTSSSVIFGDQVNLESFTESSPGLLPHLTLRHLELEQMAQPEPRPALIGLGFNLHEWAGWTDIESVIDTGNGVDEVLESSASLTYVEPLPTPTLGFNSPTFWINYAATIYGSCSPRDEQKPAFINYHHFSTT